MVQLGDSIVRTCNSFITTMHHVNIVLTSTVYKYKE